MKAFAYRWMDTPVHRIHPLVAIVWAISCMLLVFVIDDPLLLAVLFVAMLPGIFLAKIASRWWAFFKLALIFSALIVVLNALFMHQGTTILYSFPWEVPTMGHFDITVEAIAYAIGMSLRLIAVITIFAVLTYTVDPDDLFELLMRTKVMQRTAFVVSLAVSYVPTMLRDMDSIQVSLQTRGYEIDDRRLVERLKRKSMILVPLLTNSLDRAIQKAESMEARAFGTGKGRTCLFRKKMTRFDTAMLAVALLPAAAFTASIVLPFGQFQFYPQLEQITLTAAYLAGTALLFLSVASVDLLSIFKKRVDLE